MAFPQHLGELGVVVGEAVEGVSAQEVGAAVTDVGDPHAVAVEVRGDDGGGHAGVDGILLCRAEDGAVCRLDGTLQFRTARVGVADLIREAGEDAIDGGLAGDFTGGSAADAVAQDEKAAVEIEAEGVLIGVAGAAHIALRGCPDADVHRWLVLMLRLLGTAVVAKAQLNGVG